MTAAILDRIEADGSDHVLARPARARPRAVPERVRRLPRRRPRARARAGAGRARRPLPDRRSELRPRRRTTLDGPVRGRRVRLHRPARRQPARLELAQRVLRLRHPRRPRGASPSDRRAAPPAAGVALRATDRRDPRGGLALRRPAPRRRRPRAPARRPLPARAADRPLGARAARVARRPPPPDFPLPDPGLDGVHLVVDRAGGCAASAGPDAMLLGVDVGGTFTDAVLFDGALAAHGEGADHARRPVARGARGGRGGARARRRAGRARSRASPTG